MLPNTDRRFPNSSGHLSEAAYIERVSSALRDELGATRAASKSIMNWTGASDHTARNWINGVSGPNGHYLIDLMRHSDAVLSAVLEMSVRQELCLALDIHAAEVAIAKASGAIEMLRRQRQASARRK